MDLALPIPRLLGPLDDPKAPLARRLFAQRDRTGFRSSRAKAIPGPMPRCARSGRPSRCEQGSDASGPGVPASTLVDLCRSCRCLVGRSRFALSERFGQRLCPFRRTLEFGPSFHFYAVGENPYRVDRASRRIRFAQNSAGRSISLETRSGKPLVAGSSQDGKHPSIGRLPIRSASDDPTDQTHPADRRCNADDRSHPHNAPRTGRCKCQRSTP